MMIEGVSDMTAERVEAVIREVSPESPGCFAGAEVFDFGRRLVISAAERTEHADVERRIVS